MHNVLVIDDVDDVRQAVVKTLQHFGFATREARNGRAGIQMAIEDAPDLIICDVRMPDMDGFRTLNAIRDNPAIANIPFIFLTGALEKSDVRRGMVSGADDYLTKPFTPEELFEAVATRLARQTELKCEFFKARRKSCARAWTICLRVKSPARWTAFLGSPLRCCAMPAGRSPRRWQESARRINESILRLNRLAKSLA